MTRQNAPTCEDCYFRRHGLCAMTPERPCPTFRAATRTLQPPRQPRLVPLAVSAAAIAELMAGEQARRERTPWVQLTVIGLVALYTILFIVLNTHSAKVSFVFGTTRISVIWVILLSLAVGFVLGVLGTRLHRRRKRRS